MTTKHQIAPENAQTIHDWLATRGGIAIWSSANPADPSGSWTTPVNHADGSRRTEKPHWSALAISRVITDPAEIEVVVPKEIRRFHIAVRMGTNGLILKLTDASSRRVRQAVQKASQQHGTEAWYAFDYSTQEAVIYVADKKVSLPEWMKQ